MNLKLKNNLGYVIFLSVVAATGGFLFGYDAAVISGTIKYVTIQFDLNTIEQGWFVGCALTGSIFGVSVAGILSDSIGRKKTMMISAVLFTASGIGCAISGSFAELVVCRILGGIGIGVVSIISPLYISEISITQYRGRLVSLYQLAITVGFLGAYFVNYLLLDIARVHTPGAGIFSKIFVTEFWRSMLGMSAVPSLLFLIIIFLIPESPRWLILKNKKESAFPILNRIYHNEDIARTQIQETQNVIRKEKKNEWSILLKPGIRKAVMIGAAIAILGQFMGVNAVLYYGPTIFMDSGLSSGDSLFYQVLVGLVNSVTTVIALLIIDKVGRKKLVYWGVSGMIISLVAIGIYFIFGKELSIPSVVLLILFLLYIFCCAISICAVIFVLLSEMFPMEVRGLAMSVAGFSLWLGTYLIGQLTPWLLKNLSPAGTFFLFAVVCIPYMLIVWKLIPETTGKSLEEIELFWTKNDSDK
jgi:MFS transporter, SP family, arabinose:H+ symporter